MSHRTLLTGFFLYAPAQSSEMVRFLDLIAIHNTQHRHFQGLHWELAPNSHIPKPIWKWRGDDKQKKESWVQAAAAPMPADRHQEKRGERIIIGGIFLVFFSELPLLWLSLLGRPEWSLRKWRNHWELLELGLMVECSFQHQNGKKGWFASTRPRKRKFQKNCFTGNICYQYYLDAFIFTPLPFDARTAKVLFEHSENATTRYIIWRDTTGVHWNNATSTELYRQWLYGPSINLPKTSGKWHSHGNGITGFHIKMSWVANPNSCPHSATIKRNLDARWTLFPNPSCCQTIERRW